MNTGEYELPPTSPVDIRFTEDMSKKMTVPHHILVGGGDADRGQVTKHEVSNGMTAAHTMNVPDRICVTGQQSPYRPPPREIELDALGMAPIQHDPVLLSTPPSTLTVTNTKFPEAQTHGRKSPDSPVEDPSSESDVTMLSHFGLPTTTGQNAVVNPQDELARLKKTVQKLNGKVYQLEENDRFREKRDFWLICVCAVYIGIKVFKSVMQEIK